jgi:hypothetical protein
MKKTLLSLLSMLLLLQLPAQNLVTNPDAESLPRGTGWTIVSAGALTCTSAPTDNIVNWTMKPNGTTNYPFDHTTGMAGGTVFFSGCDTYFQGPFELQQTIDISVDAALIDLGTEVYSFGGYIQTPVSNQTDQGRFIVDFMDASNTVLGSSYNSGWQSYFGGSGTGWRHYTSTRIAPAGTRSIRIRMQTEIHFNQPAINVYFDDISLTKPIIVPVTLLSFTGEEQQGSIRLEWATSNEVQFQQFELEESFDGRYFNRIATFPSGSSSYRYIQQQRNAVGEYFYRLKMKNTGGSASYSHTIFIKTRQEVPMQLYPNPTSETLTVRGNLKNGVLSLISYSGQTLLTVNSSTSPLEVDVSRLPNGLYIVRFSNHAGTFTKKLFIQH